MYKHCEKYGCEIRLRDESLAGKGFTNRYEKAMTSTFTTSQALVTESDPFCRLVPFWQLELYINKVLLDGKKFNKYRITHDELVHGKRLIFDLK